MDRQVEQRQLPRPPPLTRSGWLLLLCQRMLDSRIRVAVTDMTAPPRRRDGVSAQDKVMRRVVLNGDHPEVLRYLDRAKGGRDARA